MMKAMGVQWSKFLVRMFSSSASVKINLLSKSFTCTLKVRITESIIEYPELKGTHKHHWSPAPGRGGLLRNLQISEMIDLKKIVLCVYDCSHVHGSISLPCSLSRNPKPNSLGCFSSSALMFYWESEVLVNVIKPFSPLLCIKNILASQYNSLKFQKLESAELHQTCSVYTS